MDSATAACLTTGNPGTELAELRQSGDRVRGDLITECDMPIRHIAGEPDEVAGLESHRAGL